MKAILFLLIVVVAIGPVLGQNVEIGPSVQVSSQRPTWEHNEVVLATDPNDSNHLLAGSMFLDPNTGDYSVVTYVSFDGGRSWAPTLFVGRDDPGLWDPAVAFGCDGSAYSVSLKGSTTGARSKARILVHRSLDGGKTWLAPSILPWMDREFITVDCTNSKFRGRIYIHGMRKMQTMDGEKTTGTGIFVSDDDGKSFTEIIVAPSPTDHENSVQGNGIVISDGTYFAPVTDTPHHSDQPYYLKVLKSENGGSSFSKAITVGEKAEGNELPSFAVDPSQGPYHDRIYAVWADPSKGSSRSFIKLSYSSDKGFSWSEPITVDYDAPNNPRNVMATVAVNRDGVVGVMWYDRRDSTNNLDWQVRFAASSDGGKTFSPSVKIPDAIFSNQKPPTTAHLGIGGGGGYQNNGKDIYVVPSRSESYGKAGDTAGLSATADGLFHALWIDNRTGIGQVWTTAIKVSGNITPELPTEVRGLEDITRKVTFEFNGQEYNNESGTLSYKACLVNTSGETLVGPIKARVIETRPDGAEVLNADNRQSGAGAIFEYTPLLTNDVLKPGQRSGCKLISLRVSDKEGSQTAQKGFATKFPILRLRVFGKVVGR